MISYPASLPVPTHDLSVTIDYGSLRTDMESGSVRQEQMFLDSQNATPVKWLMTDSEWRVFASWVHYALNQGNAWFQTPLATGGGIVDHVVRIQGGKLDAKPQRGLLWTVTATLDIEQPNRHSEQDLIVELLLADGGSLESFVTGLEASIPDMRI